MNLQQFLMIKHAGKTKTKNKYLKNYWKTSGPGGGLILAGGATDLGYKFGIPLEATNEAWRGVMRRYHPELIDKLGFSEGMAYPTLQRAMAGEWKHQYFDSPPKLFGMSEGAGGKVLRNKELYAQVVKQAPRLLRYI